SWIEPGRILIVSNRFQVDCYALPSGKLQWRTILPRNPAWKDAPRLAVEYPPIPMRPVIAAGRVYVRQIMTGPPTRSKGPLIGVATLACLNRDDGKILW